MLDLIAHRNPFYDDAVLLFSLVDNRKLNAVVAAMSFATCAYVLEKKMRHDELLQALRNFSTLVSIANESEKIVLQAISEDCKFLDIEDAMQYYIAIRERCDYIITRNQKDYKYSEIPVMTAGEFMSNYTEHTINNIP